MRRRPGWATVWLAAGCSIPGFEHDPHAVAPRYERWEAVVASPADSAYEVGLQTVIDAGYTLAVASRDTRVLTTNRRTLHAGSGFDATSYDTRITVAVLRLGTDSVRLAVTGATCVDDECSGITARRGGPAGPWQFVRGLGETILTRLAAGGT
jgi:hypothetical protein